MADAIDDTANSNINSKSIEKENMETDGDMDSNAIPGVEQELSGTKRSAESSATNDNSNSAAAEQDSSLGEPKTNSAEQDDLENKSKSRSETEQIDIHRPVKRARTAYFIFADERRPEVQAQVSSSILRSTVV